MNMVLLTGQEVYEHGDEVAAISGAHPDGVDAPTHEHTGDKTLEQAQDADTAARKHVYWNENKNTGMRTNTLE